MYILGQSFGVLAAIINIFRPQFSRKKHIISCTLIGNLLCALNFIFIGKAGAAPLVCMVAVFQSMLALLHDRRNTDAAFYEKLFFLALYLGVGLFGFAYSQNFAIEMSWRTTVELLPVIGALMLMLSNFAGKEQVIRFFLLLNALVWIVYNLIVGSTSVLSNIVSLCSTSYALWKYRKN